MFQLPGPRLDLGDRGTGVAEAIPAHMTYHHVLNMFDMVMQGTKTVQELMNELTKYAARMVQQRDDYTLW
jgi:hypothetical protein